MKIRNTNPRGNRYNRNFVDIHAELNGKYLWVDSKGRWYFPNEDIKFTNGVTSCSSCKIKRGLTLKAFRRYLRKLSKRQPELKDAVFSSENRFNGRGKLIGKIRYVNIEE